MSKTILLKRGSAAAVNNYVGEPGELVIDTDTKKLLLMDGKTLGGRSITSDNITRLNIKKFGNDNSGKDIVFLKQLIYDNLIANQSGYRLYGLEISLDNDWISAWNMQDTSYKIQDGSTWTFQNISEVNGYSKGFCQILVSTYQQQGLFTFTCLDGNMDKVYKLDCSTTGGSNNQYYREYTDGYKFVTGIVNSGSNNYTVSLPAAFNGTNYYVVTGYNFNGALKSGYGHITITSKTTSSFSIHSETAKANVEYMVYGY